MRKKTIRRYKTTEKCYYCTEKKTPDYKDIEILQKFVSDRGKIYNRNRSGICAKHQRPLAKSIKRARHLALLPFLTQIN